MCEIERVSRPVLVHLTSDETRELRQQASREQRSLSSYGRLLIREGIERRTSDANACAS